MTTIIDYGMGNLGSVKNMLKRTGEQAIISSDKSIIKDASKIILPGVGAFDNAVHNLHRLDLFSLLKEKASDETCSILGICLGMQLLTKGSEEGTQEGLGLVDAVAKKFDFRKCEEELPVPHMGWNRVKQVKPSSLFDTMPEDPRFYFVHSFAVECADQGDILGTTFYGYDFVSCFERNNIIGVQFHPEKSHKFGMQFFKHFMEAY